MPNPLVKTVFFSSAITVDPVLTHGWVQQKDQPGQDMENLRVIIHTDHKFQEIDGIGGAFSELGWAALEHASETDRALAIKNLYDAREGAGLNFCRLPIGSSDFGINAYSLNDNDGDYVMEKFSLARDEERLIPFIKAAKNINPALRLHASPWSPPAWMKTNSSMVGGSLRDEECIYRAYAIYLRKFCEGYAGHGIPIDRLMIQNEPDSPSPFPSCEMPPEQMIRFAVKFLDPEFKCANLATKIWAGTFRTITGLQAHRVLANTEMRKLISGVGFQYSYPETMQDLQRLYPEKKIMHTESVAYNKENLPEQAVALFYDFMTYMNAGCSVYSYWNTVLDEGGLSAWGWPQNSMVTVDRDSGKITYNPDYHVMRLLSANIQPGARRVECFCFIRKAIAFQNPDGSVVAFFWNNGGDREASIEVDDCKVVAEIPAGAVAVVRIET